MPGRPLGYCFWVSRRHHGVSEPALIRLHRQADTPIWHLLNRGQLTLDRSVYRLPGISGQAKPHVTRAVRGIPQMRPATLRIIIIQRCIFPTPRHVHVVLTVSCDSAHCVHVADAVRLRERGFVRRSLTSYVL